MSDRNLLLLSHGPLCEGLKKSVEMIMGPQENIIALPLSEEMGIDDYKEKVQEILKTLPDPMVFVDVLGGTPSGTMTRLLAEGIDVPVYAGMNMPMVIEFLNSTWTDSGFDPIKAGAAGIVSINDILASSMEDDEDE